MAKPISEAQAAKLIEDTGELQKAYMTAFSGPPGNAVLADLARFCRANEPCFMENDRYHALLEGRREVWLHLQAWMKSPVEDLMERRLGYSYRVVKIEPEDEDNG